MKEILELVRYTQVLNSGAVSIEFAFVLPLRASR
jgi:hypothetical protein